MARTQRPIRTQAFVHVGERLVNVDDLTPQQRDYIGAHLRVAMLNAYYDGKATFRAEGLPSREEVFGKDGCTYETDRVS